VLQAKKYERLPHVLADESALAADRPIVHAGWIRLWNVCALAASLVSDLPVSSPLRRHEVSRAGEEDDSEWAEIRELVKRSRAGGETRQEEGSNAETEMGGYGTERVGLGRTRDRMFTYGRAGDGVRENRVMALYDRIEAERRWGPGGEEMDVPLERELDRDRERVKEEEDMVRAEGGCGCGCGRRSNPDPDPALGPGPGE